MLEIVREAAERCGGVTRLSRTIGYSRPTIYGWKVVPAEAAVAIEKATRGMVKREQIRPDLWKPGQSEDAREVERAARALCLFWGVDPDQMESRVVAGQHAVKPAWEWCQDEARHWLERRKGRAA